MIITDAIWEMRNMGVATKEVQVTETDTDEDVKRMLTTLDTNYSVVRTPVARLALYQVLTELGYSFAEVSIGIMQNLKDIQYNSATMKRLCGNLGFQRTEDLTRIIENIRKGMFTTDRVVLDPYFSEQQAANRYIGWMGDELKRGSQFYEYLYKGRAIGFVCMREKDGYEFYSVLGGLYPSDHLVPFGAALLYKQLEIAKSLGGRVLSTSISSNNVAAVRAYSLCGYDFVSLSNIFVKHHNKEQGGCSNDES